MVSFADGTELTKVQQKLIIIFKNTFKTFKAEILKIFFKIFFFMFVKEHSAWAQKRKKECRRSLKRKEDEQILSYSALDRQLF